MALLGPWKGKWGICGGGGGFGLCKEPGSGNATPEEKTRPSPFKGGLKRGYSSEVPIDSKPLQLGGS